MTSTAPPAVLYRVEVVHTRLRPTPHKLTYKVFSLLVDADRLAEVGKSSALISHNRFNLVSLHDCDFGDRSGTPPADQARRALGEKGLASYGARIMMLAYPRVLGAVFNPLTVYLCHDDVGGLGAVIHEVTNTYGERKAYVLPVEPRHVEAAVGSDTCQDIKATDCNGTQHRLIAQSCTKEMSVSPFTPGGGAYGFRLTTPGERMTVGVSYRDRTGPVLKTHFAGQRHALTSRQLLRQFCITPFHTQRVLGAIHLEALKLWWKGVPVVRRHRSPAYSVSPTGRP